ncbi:MBL fold metallo-hydrolase [Natrialbaceae archaeon A-gly3]
MPPTLFIDARDGYRGWGQVYDVVPIATRRDNLEILQLQRRGKGCLGYIVGCRQTGEAAAIDVTRYNQQFVKATRDHGFRIEAVLETHIHADHLMMGARELRDEPEVGPNRCAATEESVVGDD